MIAFDTHPDQYKHWRLSVDGRVATLTLDVDEAGGLVPGYELKLNSYDLGVDIELYDAVQRLRFEHPNVAAVVVYGTEAAEYKVMQGGAELQTIFDAYTSGLFIEVNSVVTEASITIERQ